MYISTLSNVSVYYSRMTFRKLRKIVENRRLFFQQHGHFALQNVFTTRLFWILNRTTLNSSDLEGALCMHRIYELQYYYDHVYEL